MVFAQRPKNFNKCTAIVEAQRLEQSLLLGVLWFVAPALAEARITRLRSSLPYLGCSAAFVQTTNRRPG